MDWIKENTQAISWGPFLAAVTVITMACAMVVVAYGMDNIVMGAHDAFHDLRHVYGMPCH